ncbi:MAG TPA: hypothetical protein VNW49_04345 [Puia sp.]|nr:hypothetical protein [Puia sp.]
MRFYSIFILLGFVSMNVYGQKTEGSASWSDTSYRDVQLRDSLGDKKIVVIEIGRKAIIYLEMDALVKEAKQDLSKAWDKPAIKEIIHFLDSASLRSDTIIADNYRLKSLDYLISDQLMKGNARVFYRKEKSYVVTISHRLERYGEYANRFFYLPDKRPFFYSMEMSGILDKNDPFGESHYEAYLKLGEKLASLRQE